MNDNNNIFISPNNISSSNTITFTDGTSFYPIQLPGVKIIFSQFEGTCSACKKNY